MTNSEKIYRLNIKRDDNAQKIQNLINNELAEELKTASFPRVELQRCQIKQHLNNETNKTEFCVILQNSHSTNQNVLICPLIVTNEKEKFSNYISLGININISYSKEILADITKIRFIDKRFIIFNDELVKDRYGKIHNYHFLNIMECYKALISFPKKPKVELLEDLIRYC